MCDTAVHVTPAGVLFAKNSDRDPNEAQLLDWQPPRRHDSGASVRCTWISIPEARETRAVLLSRPFWMWGAEIGANDCGVVIGNEAVFTREPDGPPALLGMDLLRLALERAQDAESAVAVLIELLETHGQGGGCGHEKRSFTYHNSFLVADARHAWVLETAGRKWAEERVQGARSISNGLTIADFANRYSDRIRSRVSACATRRRRSQALAERAKEPADLFALLRDHGNGRDRPEYSRVNGGMDAVCMHAGGTVAASQTTASWVADLREGQQRHWVTATSAPCLSLFKPVAVRDPLDLGPAPSDRADPHSLWWRHERLARRLVGRPQTAAPWLRERDALEARWLAEPPEPATAFAEHAERVARWQAETADVAADESDERPGFVRRYWARRDARAGLVGATASG